jgi:hypothetical protein
MLRLVPRRQQKVEPVIKQIEPEVVRKELLSKGALGLTGIAIILFIVVVLAKNTLVAQYAKAPSSSEVLGAVQFLAGSDSAEKAPEIPSSWDGVQKQAMGLVTEAQKKTVDPAGSVIGSWQKQVGDYFYTQALQPILDQYEKLPDDQKEEVKKKICE